jgi:hypothetical protein
MGNPELDKLLADEAAKVAAMTPEERSEYLDQIVAVQRANVTPYTGGERQARAMRPKPTLADALELPEIKALVEAARPFSQVTIRNGVSGAGQIGRTDVTNIRAALATLQTKGGA